MTLVKFTDGKVEMLDSKIIFNCTKKLKSQVQALAKIKNVPMNSIVADAVAAVIAERQADIERVMKLDDEYAQKFSQITLDLNENATDTIVANVNTPATPSQDVLDFECCDVATPDDVPAEGTTDTPVAVEHNPKN